MAPHRVRRQRWQVRAASADDAFALRSALRRENEASLLPALERAFAELDDEAGRDIHLPRLTIRVSLSSVDRLVDELPGKLLTATRLALAEALDAAPGQALTVRDLTPGARLRRYLASGQVDWFDGERDGAELAGQLAAEAALWSEAPVAAWSALLAEAPPAGPARAAFFFRFLQLLDTAGRAAWADFAGRQAVVRGGAVGGALAALRRLQAGRPVDHALRLQALALLLVSGNPAAPIARGAWRQAVLACAGQLGPSSVAERRAWESLADLLAVGLAAAEAEPPAATGEAPPDPAARPAAVDPENRPFLPVDRNNAPGLAVHACGLVLLHPYLPRLFAALGWTTEDHPRGKPLPPPCLPCAAALLHWLATGRDELYEFELGMIKLLLGLAPDDPLPVADGLLGKAERAEGAALLAAVVAHWPALGKTTIDGLRLSFLRRGGLLYPAPDGWLLRPQAESFDLLLDRLPWGIAIVRLPWMQRTLHTEWTPA